MTEFVILKTLKINIHPPKAPIIKEVIWHPPITNWMKANTDDVVVKNSPKIAYGGIFRNSYDFPTGCFAKNLSTDSAFIAEINGVMLATEMANDRNWQNVWLETDTMLLMMTFKNSPTIPWTIRNRRLICIEVD